MTSQISRMWRGSYLSTHLFIKHPWMLIKSDKRTSHPSCFDLHYHCCSSLSSFAICNPSTRGIFNGFRARISWIINDLRVKQIKCWLLSQRNKLPPTKILPAVYALTSYSIGCQWVYDTSRGIWYFPRYMILPTAYDTSHGIWYFP